MNTLNGVSGSVLRFCLLVVLLLGSIPAFALSKTEETSKNGAKWVAEQSCAGCHEPQYEQWRSSHHANAIAEWGGPDTEKIFELNENEKPLFQIGHEPLKQALIATKNGHLYAYPLAFDTISQQWFDLYPQASNDPTHPMHWRQPPHLANTQCISCHVTAYNAGYNSEQQTFSSSWLALGVGCQSCHGPASEHLEWVRQPAASSIADKGFTLSMNAAEQQLQVCAQCHSRRQEIQPFSPNVGIQQQFLVSPLSADLYEVDGTIKDEVFEYGSFLQSKMHRAGVTCSNCHNAHTANLVQPGNAVCGQCHNASAKVIQTVNKIDTTQLRPAVFDSANHHFHQPGSAGAQCVNCHMPGQIYMGNDVRHDHSFSSPNPAQAIALEHSDACLSCHQEWPAQQLVEAFRKWYPQAISRDNGYARALYNARNGKPGAATNLIKLLKEGTQPAIRHAALLAELTNYPSLTAQQLVVQSLQHADAMVRRAAINVAPTLFTESWLTSTLPRLLTDSQRAVRVAALEQLLALDYPFSRPTESEQLQAYVNLQKNHLATAQGHFNLASVAAVKGQQNRVSQHLQSALLRNALDVPSLVAFAQWLEGADVRAAQEFLLAAHHRLPDAAEVPYALGLMLIRHGDLAGGIGYLKQAMQRAPDNSHYAYVLAIATHDSGDTATAQQLLRSALAKAPEQRHLRIALWQYSDEATERRRLIEQLRQINPFDPWLEMEPRD